MKRRSAIFAAAVEQYRQIRDEFEDVRTAAYVRAEEATSGYLLNARGLAKGIDPWSLFIGSDIRAYAYASEELIEHWASHPRITFTAYENQRFEGESA